MTHDFLDIINEIKKEVPQEPNHATLPTETDETSPYQNEIVSDNDVNKAELLYRKAVINKEKVAELSKKAQEALKEAEKQLVVACGLKDYSNDRFKLTHDCAKGLKSWKTAQDAHPEINFEEFRGPKRYSWTIKLATVE